MSKPDIGKLYPWLVVEGVLCGPAKEGVIYEGDIPCADPQHRWTEFSYPYGMFHGASGRNYRIVPPDNSECSCGGTGLEKERKQPTS